MRAPRAANALRPARPSLLVGRTSPVVHVAAGRLLEPQESRRREARADRDGAALARSNAGGADDVEDVHVERGIGERCASVPQGGHGLAQAVGPAPGGVVRLANDPAPGILAPPFDALRIPVVPEQVGGALRAVE